MKTIIKLYQKIISPLLPNCCRFYPSCSQYYFLAIEKYGQTKAFFMFLKRIKKCHPWNKGGIDMP